MWQAFKKTPATYSLTTLTLVEQLIERAQLEASNLTHESKELWLRDTQLLKFSRSEERRVGKECRSRRWPNHHDKNHPIRCARTIAGFYADAIHPHYTQPLAQY